MSPSGGGYSPPAASGPWLAQSAPEGAVAWLTLDPSDCDPGRLAAAQLRLFTDLRTVRTG